MNTRYVGIVQQCHTYRAGRTLVSLLTVDGTAYVARGNMAHKCAGILPGAKVQADISHEFMPMEIVAIKEISNENKELENAPF